MKTILIEFFVRILDFFSPKPPLVTDDFVREIESSIKPGFVILSKTNGMLSNLFIPGHYKHAAIYIGNGEIVESTTDGVKKNSLQEHLFEKDHIALMDPIKADCNDRQKACLYASSALNAGYDFEFKYGNSNFYCSELIYLCYQDKLFIDKRIVMPQDIRESSFFKTVCEFKGE